MTSSDEGVHNSKMNNLQKVESTKKPIITTKEEAPAVMPLPLITWEPFVPPYKISISPVTRGAMICQLCREAAIKYAGKGQLSMRVLKFDIELSLAH